ncbi:MAG: carboxypeptidase regulatory-like domain-containing protein, partial [Muribaculaceae bacterium]|nr:carboxypeptidase regulatory-like domain-containing protein [Muribaculaceae bacterium]
MFKKIKFIALFLAVLAALNMNAQITTASLAGKVVDENKEVLIGATVKAVHTPSGTNYTAVSNTNGLFTIQGMRTGGPYRVEVSYIGYANEVFEDVYLQLGNTFDLNVQMQLGSKDLQEVLVTAKKGIQQAGMSHNFSTMTIELAPTIERNIYDVVKNMPMTNRSKIGGISFAGTNNRYNSFQIDGSVHNDVFGLTSSGTNGGQASANPISMDAIQEIQVVLAPFDVRQSGFTGGGINAITKQGTNDFHATYYTYYNNQDFYGKYDAANDYVKSPLTKQHYTTIGGNVSGPILKDKLFFFVNVENHNESYPTSYYPGYSSNYLSVSTAQALVDKYKALTGIEESFSHRNVDRNAFDILARLDWNINDRHKLALRYQHLDAYDDKYSAGYTTYYFNNSSYRFNNLTNSFVAELNSNLSNKLYNEFRVGYTRVRDNREVPYQGPTFWIKNVAVEDGSRANMAIDLGTDYSSGANRLDQDIYLLEDNLSFYLGKHTVTVGTHNEYFKMKNLFIQYNNGEWVYNSLDDFLAIDPTATVNIGNPSQFVFRCTNPMYTGGNYLWAPTIRAGQFGLYVQDKIDANRNLQFTIGFRADMPVMFDKPTANNEFNQYVESRHIDAVVGKMPTAKVMLSPRFGFRWFADDAHKTLFRGGVGLFTGRVPFVWISNAFANNGVEFTGTTINTVADMPNITTDTRELVNSLGKGTPLSPDIVTIDRKFRYPQVFRANLAWEQQLPDNWKFTIEGLYSKTFNNAYFQNLALNQGGSTYAVAGVEASAAPFYLVDRNYYSIVNMSNTDRGYSYNLSASVEKSFDFGLDLRASYTFGRAKSVNDVISSVAYSSWRMNYAIDTNHPELSYSSFDQPHRINVNLSYNTPKYLNNLLQTNIAVSYNGYSGQRYSLTMSETADYNGDGYKGNSMLYIPTREELANMIFTDITAKDSEGKTYVKTSAEEQKVLFEQFINDNHYAKHHRGQYAARNGSIGKFEHQIDLHFAESLFVLPQRGSKIVITADILNFA